MKRCFGYIRVSTQRQGVHGVSLQEQRAAIEAYAGRNKLPVIAWFEERETAAKRGRRVFATMLKQLARGKADGVIIHKIDRGARNPRDWADLGELIDRGIDVHLAHDAIDLRSRGGRLSADIQAVVAADFIRNLREETRKGFYGRLKQGLYPLRAPVGYLDMGRGKPKAIDPVKAPLVREAFSLYATGKWNFHNLRDEMERRGLRGWKGQRISINGLSTLLNNSFYMGLMHIQKTGETFEGQHTPIITKALFDRVRMVLRDRREGPLPWRHDFLFRRLLRCARCGGYLVGERIKERYVYYRCHGRTCQGTILKEAEVESTLIEKLSRLSFTTEEWTDLKSLVADLRGRSGEIERSREKAFRLLAAQTDERLEHLTDVFLDEAIDHDAYNARKAKLLNRKRDIADQIASIQSGSTAADRIAEIFELANSVQIRYGLEDPWEKRATVESVTSNFVASGKNLAITLKSPYQELQEFRVSHDCDPHRETVRTRVEKILALIETAARNEMEVRKGSAPTPMVTSEVPELPTSPGP